jgi:hypothetical protein
MNIPPETASTNQPQRKDASGRPVWGPLALIGAALVGSLLATLYLRERPTGPRADDRDLAREANQDLERRNYRPISGSLEALLNDPSYKPIPTQTHPLLGQPAPEFRLADTDGNAWSLSQKVKDGPVVLVFYYGYNCNHCVSQLFGLHKDIAHFRELGAAVVAVSADPPDLTRERYKKYGRSPSRSSQTRATRSRPSTAPSCPARSRTRKGTCCTGHS